ncbi:MAG TPA: shikimate dehydrogenase [Gammaproteobacteria bacterium]|nr:shikimate dehydrogenase [Gammaproteobacteria bacterium]
MKPASASPDRYAVIGDPVEHSLSPHIHAVFAASAGQRMTYGRERVRAGELAAWIEAFGAGGGRGCNVTLPLKEEALAAVDRVSARARSAGAANTLWRDVAGHWCADNTDGIGLLRDLTVNLGWRIAGSRVLLLGAGGAARGVIGPLLDAGVANIDILNRTPARAQAVVRAFPRAGSRLAVLVPDQSLPAPVDLVLNATSAGLSGALPEWPPGLFSSDRRPRCYDLLYGQKGEVWQTAARAAGALAVSDGLGMLVEQAAAAFWLWRGLWPDTARVLAELRAG